MSAVAKNLIPQLVPPAPQPGPKLFLNDSVTSLRMIDLNEARQLSQFVPVIVLVPASSAEYKATALQTPGNNSLGETSATSKLLEFFGTAMTLLRAKSPESGWGPGFR